MSETAATHLPPQRRPVRPRVYSVKQTSQVTNLSMRQIHRLVRDGRLKSIKLDGRRLILVSSVEALLPDE
jgi:excisionase family DNA binding protein